MRLMARKATALGGDVCFRCNRTLAAPNQCRCTDAQLDQFLSESEDDQKAVNRMLFISSAPHQVQMERWGELQKLYTQNEQLAARNGVRSPFGSP